uniref:Uncharacterized protein n=1 Tax=Arundo donax TaxID=35708 RepID=A0A0A9G7Y9_ARUDO
MARARGGNPRTWRRWTRAGCCVHGGQVGGSECRASACAYGGSGSGSGSASCGGAGGDGEIPVSGAGRGAVGGEG